MTQTKSKILPVLPLKNSTLFPYVLMPLSVGRASSIAAAESALATEEKEIFVVAQRDPATEVPETEDLHTMGTRAIIRKMHRSQVDLMQLIVQGEERCRLVRLERHDSYLNAEVAPELVTEEDTPEIEALYRAVLDLVGKALTLTQPQSNVQIEQLIGQKKEPLRTIYLITSMLSLELAREQALLEANTLKHALNLLHEFLTYEVQVLELRKGITSKTQSEMSKQQREYFLRQQLRTIQEELGEKDPEQAEVDLLRDRLQEKDLPPEVREEIERELTRLERLPAASPENHVVRSHIELCLEVPWRNSSSDRLDIPYARQVLDEDHYDLEQIKKRILEHLAVMKLNPSAKAPILCFVGPPGVGKTSLGQSIARALDRKFERMSLGGLHDESELRGHRRTYIGAMPGRIIQAIRRVGINNPVLMLDEVDKLGRDFRGDPAAALLEILDPEQNREFRDNYLDLPFDLSKTFFIATANSLETIPAPLLDRMEIIHLSGYSQSEKLEIALRYLLPRQIREAGLTPEQVTIQNDALKTIISSYTREAGVRQLERAIAKVARKVALEFAENRTETFVVDSESLGALLGPEKFFPERARGDLPPGVAVGLAWTQSGGEVLFIEATLLPEGKGFTLTGQLGEVMRESAQAAQSYIWSHAQDFGIDQTTFKDYGVHIHIPAGAIPKDGPSAGITIAAALASAYCRRPVDPNVAMTGEITLSGRVLPVGGIKEKVLAGHRAGIQKVILPSQNRSDLQDLPQNVRDAMQFVFVERIEEALEGCVPGMPVAKTASLDSR